MGLILLLLIYNVDFNQGIISWLINLKNKQIPKLYVEMKVRFKCFAEFLLSLFNRLQQSNLVNKKRVD